MAKRIALIDMLKSVETEDDLRKIGFEKGNTIINWPKYLRKKMWVYGDSNDEDKHKIWLEMSEKYTRDTFHPKDELLCVVAENGKNLLYPSVVYKRSGDSLKFKGIDIFEKSFAPSPIIDYDTGAQTDVCYFANEKFGEGKELEAVLSLLQ